jgi:hypothetical protein
MNTKIHSIAFVGGLLLGGCTLSEDPVDLDDLDDLEEVDEPTGPTGPLPTPANQIASENHSQSMPVGLCQNQFFSTFGDNTQEDDGAAVDDAYAGLYNIPPAFLAIAELQWWNGIARTDEIVVDAAHPIVLQGYTPFDYETARWAFLRFDIYWTGYASEGFSTIDDTFTQFPVTFDYYDRLVTRLHEYRAEPGFWISIRLDLITGNAHATSIDAFGNPRIDFGQFATFGDSPNDQGNLYEILKDASDGRLFAELYDDQPLSYVALYGSAEGTICN